MIEFTELTGVRHSYRGRTLVSAVKRVYGRKATLRREHDTALNPTCAYYMVLKPAPHGGCNVVTRIVTDI